VIPTGVFVRSIAFTSGSEVSVSGYVWQRYDRIRHGHIPRGFSLPETFDPGQSQIDETQAGSSTSNTFTSSCTSC
jgi:hypothetical protein